MSEKLGLFKRYFMFVCVLLIAGSALAQGRPPKEICLEIGPGCSEIDSEEVIELKIVFNSLVDDLTFWLSLKQDFNNAEKVTQRFNDFNDKIAVLQTVKDAVANNVVRNLFQIKIDATIRRRDELHSVEAGSKREQSDGAQNIIAQLNQQLNDIQFALNQL